MGNPGDFLILDTGSEADAPWTWIEGGTPPSTDGTWIDDGAGNLYPATITNNVGIGTDDPHTKLEVARLGNSWTGPDPAVATGVFIHNGNNQPQSPANLQFGAGNDSASDIYFGDSDRAISGLIGYSHTDDSMRFDTDGVERVRIDKNGHVGIGEEFPQTALHVVGDVTLEDVKSAPFLGTDATGKIVPVSAITEPEADARYLRIDADAPDQTRVAGKATFAELTTHEDGVTVNGGTHAVVGNGIVGLSNGLDLTASQKPVAKVRNSNGGKNNNN